jgi:hypothetical protein
MALFLAVCLCAFQSCMFQTKAQQNIAESYIDNVIEKSEEESDFNQLEDDLSWYVNHPLNINAASAKELEDLHLLNDFQIQGIISYIQEKGALQSIYELSYLYGFSEEDARKIAPFIAFGPKEGKTTNFRNLYAYSENRLFIRFSRIVEKMKGFEASGDSLQNQPAYKGNPWRYYARYSFTSGDNLRGGFTLDKDPGEEFFKGSNKQGFDFSSGFLQLENKGKIKNLIVGDYLPEFGQGLATWSGLSFGKGSDVWMMRRKSRGLVKYSGTDENRFLRGGGITISLGKTDISLFGSRKSIDANIAPIQTDSSGERVVSSLLNTGIHATGSEVKSEKTLKESIIGGNISLTSNKTAVGITLINTHYGNRVMKKEQPYNIYDFKGSNNMVLSSDYRANLGDVKIFGEEALNPSGSYGLLNGALLMLNSSISVMLLHRYYKENFTSLQGNAFGVNSKNNNEHGLYAGCTIQAFKNIKVSSYIDLYRFPWLRYRVDEPSTGEDFMVQTEYDPSLILSMYLKYNRRIKQESTTDNIHKTSSLVDIITSKWRFNLSCNISEQWQFRNRMEFLNYRKGKSSEQGYYIHQDIFFRPQHLPLCFTFRYAIFETASYSSCIYSYENDLPFTYSALSFYGKGTRIYLIINMKLTRKLDLYFRYSQTYRSDVNETGSGPLTIEGKTKSELKFAIKMNF